MFIELFITNIAILNYHRGYLLLLRFEKKSKVFAFRQKILEKYFMQILDAVKASFVQNFQEKTILIRNIGLFYSFKKQS